MGNFNVNASPPEEDLYKWLRNFENAKNPDVYVVGFQEVTQLNTQNVWNADQANTKLWFAAILKTISDEHHQFVELRSYQLVGLVLAVFVRKDQIQNFREVHSERSKVGFAGIAGNKGGISIRFNYHRTSFCFTCCHLAAGQSNIEERNQDWESICDSTLFRTTLGQLTIFDHE